jgi:uncharacterized membrane protein
MSSNIVHIRYSLSILIHSTLEMSANFKTASRVSNVHMPGGFTNISLISWFISIVCSDMFGLWESLKDEGIEKHRKIKNKTFVYSITSHKQK